jgi:hypothetical protein
MRKFLRVMRSFSVGSTFGTGTIGLATSGAGTNRSGNDRNGYISLRHRQHRETENVGHPSLPLIYDIRKFCDHIRSSDLRQAGDLQKVRDISVGRSGGAALFAFLN